jgi:predicted RNA-binding Zn ribbon-like protein
MDLRTMTTRPFQFELTGGAACLDFANTVDNRPSAAKRKDYLDSYGALLQWSRQAGLLAKAEVFGLQRAAARKPRARDAAFARAVRLREAIFGAFSAIAHGRPPRAKDLEAVNTELRAGMSHAQIVARGGEFSWQWEKDSADLSVPLWRIVKSAADLLTSRQLRSVRECAAEDCAWLFIDRSANQRRRWCDMKVCGNRAKARRHYLARKASARADQK